jgi:endogenous inhibitor of DNA gyrase (YacG/DUF329 family)
MRFRPFCSARCKAVDLGRWLTGAYTIPGTDEDGSAPAPTDPQAESGAPLATGGAMRDKPVRGT